MFIIVNAEEFKTKLNAALLKMKQEVDQEYCGFAIGVFHRILRETPQWTGNAVANWNVSKTNFDYSVNYTYREAGVAVAERGMTTGPKSRRRNRLGTPVAIKGDPRAIAFAANRARSTLQSITVEDHVYLANAAENLSHKSYIKMLESNPNDFLRPANRPGHMVEYTVNAVNALGVFSPVVVGSLKALSLQVGSTSNPGVPI